MAMADFLKPPAVISIGVTEYHGNAGDTIRVLAVDNFRVVRVTVSIMDEANDVMEYGDCTLQEEGSAWIYTVTGDHIPVTGQHVKAVAFDTPGNTGQAICSV